MARYKVTINIDSYKHQPCSKKNWEPGTWNDFMLALSKWKSTEKSLREVLWRIEMFLKHPPIIRDKENGGYKRYQKWFSQPKNKIRYLDRLCECEREDKIQVYGFAQGYCEINEFISELKKNGTVRIPFKEAYDIRQYYKGMDGCYMEITKA